MVDLRPNRIPFMLSDAELAAIDEWRFANKIATRAEAIRRLCQIALEVETHGRTVNSLMAALLPFAKAADTHSEQMPDAMFIDDYEQPKGQPWQSAAGLTIGDLRRARTALTACRGARWTGSATECATTRG